ncbi:MAG TPA: hypothetical protein PKG49_12675 [Nitrosomonas mobilis]|nr:hypothetical protein [Nitrosomonas mobilis]
MSKISIESKEIFAGQDHLYLIFQDAAGQEFVIRSGPENNNPLDFGDIVAAVNVPIAESEDARGNNTPAERGNRELDLGGRAAEDVWEIMKQQATNINNAGIDYDIFISAQNSNSTIASVLNSIGIAVASNIPLNTEANDLPGVSNLLTLDTTLIGTPANDIISGYVGNDILLGNNGDDSLRGNSGNDVIDGELGNDFLSGDLGNDILKAGFGQDILNGGAGNDIFGFYALGHHKVQDFILTEDQIFFDSVKTGLSNIDAVNQAITAVIQRDDGVTVEFGPDASVDLIGINFADITADMVGFAS